MKGSRGRISSKKKRTAAVRSRLLPGIPGPCCGGERACDPAVKVVGAATRRKQSTRALAAAGTAVIFVACGLFSRRAELSFCPSLAHCFCIQSE